MHNRSLMVRMTRLSAGVLSAVLRDSKYTLEEKNMWLDLYVPEVSTGYYTTGERVVKNY